MLLSTAMGILNTSVTHVGGQPVSLGFMTGDLNNLARHVAHGILRAPVPQAQSANDTHWRRAALLGSLWTFFLAGAVLGGALASRLAVWTLLLPAALLLLLARLTRDGFSRLKRSVPPSQFPVTVVTLACRFLLSR
jgi:uncharacterized membrane protein YoaK (UPF0700 family)